MLRRWRCRKKSIIFFPDKLNCECKCAHFHRVGFANDIRKRKLNDIYFCTWNLDSTSMQQQRLRMRKSNCELLANCNWISITFSDFTALEWIRLLFFFFFVRFGKSTFWRRQKSIIIFDAIRVMLDDAWRCVNIKLHRKTIFIVISTIKLKHVATSVMEIDFLRNQYLQ